MLEYQIKTKCPKAKANQFIKMYKCSDKKYSTFDEQYVRDEVKCHFIASQLNISPKIYEYVA